MSRGSVGAVLGLLLMICLSACVSTPPKPEASFISSATEWFESERNWKASGRVALSDESSGGQMSISWEEIAGRGSVSLRTRFGGQWWRLSYGETPVRLESHEGGIVLGDSAESLVSEATGWPIPVGALRHWIRGLPGPSDQDLEWDDQGRLRSLTHQGWTVLVSDYAATSHPTGVSIMLPRRFEIARPPYRIRVALRRWEWPKSSS